MQNLFFFPLLSLWNSRKEGREENWRRGREDEREGKERKNEDEKGEEENDEDET